MMGSDPYSPSHHPEFCGESCPGKVRFALIVGGDIIWTVRTAAAEVIDVREGGRELLVRDQLRHQDHEVRTADGRWERLQAATPGLEERTRLTALNFTREGRSAAVTEPRRRLARVTVMDSMSGRGHHGHLVNWDYAWETVAEAAEHGGVLPG